MLRIADEGWAWCYGAQAFGRTVTVKVEYADFRQIARSRSRPDLVASHAALRAASLDLIRSVLPTETGIRLVGGTVSNFGASASTPTLPLAAA